jgi:hypothetical protein
MPTYMIERLIPEAGKLSKQELEAIARQAYRVVNEMGPEIQWVQSFVTCNHIYCTYSAPNEEMVREHARRAGFPADRVSIIRTSIDPTTAQVRT